MSVLRQHTLLLDATGAAPLAGTSFAIVPSDADAVTDGHHAFVALVTIKRPAPTLPPRMPTAPLPTAPLAPAEPLVAARVPRPPPPRPGDGGPTPPDSPAAPTTPELPTSPTSPIPSIGAITVVVEGSFDQARWAPIGSASLLPAASSLEQLVELGPVPPYVRARVFDPSGAPAFDWTAYVALGSTAAYRARAVA